MNYEEFNKGCFEEAKRLYKTANADQRYVLESLFPELAESEDERIRKELLAFIKKRDRSGCDYDYDKWIAWLEKQGKQKEYTFKSIPRLLDMIEPTDRAKAYCQKLIDTLAKEGYNTDAKIVGECLKKMNGEDVPMAVMDEQKVSYTTTVETGNGGINALVTRDIEIPYGAKDSKLQEATYFIPKGYYAKIEGDKVVIKKGEQKPQRMVSAEAKEALYDKAAWSEEDEEMLDGIILRCEKYGHQEQINWLKSLKERIGG